MSFKKLGDWEGYIIMFNSFIDLKAIRLRKYIRSIALFTAVLFLVTIMHPQIVSSLNNNNRGLTKSTFLATHTVTDMSDETILYHARLLLSGKLAITEDISEYPVYNIQNIDWNISYTDAPSTQKHILQSLESVSILTRAYNISNDETYLTYALLFIRSFMKYESVKTNWNEYTWGDHTTALRAENLIYFLLTAGESNMLMAEKDEITNFLYKHALFLSSEDSYTENHNHGNYQDRSLLYCAYFLNCKETDYWISIVKERLTSQRNFAYTQEMVHVENSFNYSVIVYDLFEEISQIFANKGDGYGASLKNNLEMAKSFMAYALKPNGYFPQTGDTHRGVLLQAKPNWAQSNDHLAYAMTEGRSGIKPITNASVYMDAGYYIWREYWDSDNSPSGTDSYINSAWLMFRSGYKSYGHKHGDDLSFQLYAKGHDVFIDPGYYNYNYQNSITSYLRSARAHNTVIVDDKEYPFLTIEYMNKVGLVSYDLKGTEKAYDYISGKNEIYNGVSIDRHLFNLGEAYIVYDNILSGENHKYSQLFQCSEDMQIVSYNNHEVLMKLADSGYYVRVKQLLSSTKLEIINGSDKDSEYGFISYSQNQCSFVDTLKFNVYGSNADILTMITIEDEMGKVIGIDNYTFDSDSLTFNIKNDTGGISIIKPEPDSRLRETQTMPLKIDQHKDDNDFIFVNNTYHSDNISYKYAWYIYNAEPYQVIYKQGYSSNNSLKYKFDERKSYYVIAFLIDNNGIKRTSDPIFFTALE